jgi:hypothetical protein
MKTPPHLAEILGPTMWVDPRDAPQMINSITESKPFDVPRAAELGLPSQLPARNFAQVMTALTGADNRKAADERAADNRTSAEKRVADTNASREKTAAAANASREKAAGIRGGGKGTGPTPGQQGVQDRFNQREQDNLDKAEPDLHAERRSIGARLTLGTDENDKPIGKGKAALLGSRFKAVSDELQVLQFRKAKLNGATPPNQEQAAKIPDGTEVPGPDGRVWKKQDGILYLVK